MLLAEAVEAEVAWAASAAASAEAGGRRAERVAAAAAAAAVAEAAAEAKKQQALQLDPRPVTGAGGTPGGDAPAALARTPGGGRPWQTTGS